MSGKYTDFLLILVCILLSSCAQSPILISKHSTSLPQTITSETFGYRTWLKRNTEPDIVIIGIHGFCGAAVDYTNLGNYLILNQPKTALYAYEVRGQGSDPLESRRGDICRSVDWYRDLEAFTQLVEERHPNAKIIWYGESMGALIATHALHHAPKHAPPCDGLILSSPIVRFKNDVEPWKIALVKAAGNTIPLARVSLDALAPTQDVQMTQTSEHKSQSQTNNYHIETHTLRLLGILAHLIDGMNACAAEMTVPLLILHGGKDYFNDDSEMRNFISCVPDSTSVTHKTYPEAYHLLMYDQKREQIFRDVKSWLKKIRK